MIADLMLFAFIIGLVIITVKMVLKDQSGSRDEDDDWF